MKHLYESHLGGFYTSTKQMKTYCETCGDGDYYMGTFNNEEELENLLKSYVDYYDEDYIKAFIEEEFKGEE